MAIVFGFVLSATRSNLPWAELGVDMVFRIVRSVSAPAHTAGKHIEAGAKKVIIAAPGGEGVDATVVYGINHDTLKSSDTIISNASCTTNCLGAAGQAVARQDRCGARHDDNHSCLHE